MHLVATHITSDRPLLAVAQPPLLCEWRACLTWVDWHSGLLSVSVGHVVSICLLACLDVVHGVHLYPDGPATLRVDRRRSDVGSTTWALHIHKCQRALIHRQQQRQQQASKQANTR